MGAETAPLNRHVGEKGELFCFHRQGGAPPLSRDSCDACRISNTFGDVGKMEKSQGDDCLEPPMLTEDGDPANGLPCFCYHTHACF